MCKLTGALNTSRTTLMELSPRDQLKASLRRRLAFLKRNKSDSVVVQRPPQSTEAAPRQPPAVVCQKEGGVGIPTARCFGQSVGRIHRTRSFWNRSVVTSRCCVLGALWTLPQGPKVWKESCGRSPQGSKSRSSLLRSRSRKGQKCTRMPARKVRKCTGTRAHPL